MLKKILVSLCLFFSCISPSLSSEAINKQRDDDYVKIFIPKNVPFGFPIETKFFVERVQGSSYFTDETKYNCNSSHQYDWNKLTGISFTPWRTDIDALMIAWRYLIKTDTFEIAPYFNVKTARILPNANQTLIVEKNVPFKFYVDYKGINIVTENKSLYTPKPSDLETNFYLSFRISTWFGGSSLPPNDIYLYLRFD